MAEREPKGLWAAIQDTLSEVGLEVELPDLSDLDPLNCKMVCMPFGLAASLQEMERERRDKDRYDRPAVRAVVRGPSKRIQQPNESGPADHVGHEDQCNLRRLALCDVYKCEAQLNHHCRSNGRTSRSQRRV